MASAVADVLPGVRRVTLDAAGVGHVHCYLLRGAAGWTLVDTGLGGPGAGEAWREVVAGLDAPLERVVITHMHVDHVGAVADVAPLASGPVLEGRLDREQSEAAYGDGAWPGLLREHFVANGMPSGDAAAAEAAWRALSGRARPAPAEPLEPGDRVDGWEVLLLPGHADGHIGLLRDGVLVGGDVLLADITPTIGAWPGCDPDPLGGYLQTLARIESLAPRVVLPGHGEPVGDPAGRARATAAHHRARLDEAAAALGTGPRSAYEVSREIWPGDLDPAQRSLAVAEALAHLERLVRDGQAAAVDQDGARGFRAAATSR
jgi:glyoxylase-like metal-dependent hydrolase (beta-lactamase superfamily II)